MAVCCINYPEFKAGDKVVSLVMHPPEINTGTNAVIIAPWTGLLYAVQMPDGQLHRWFAWFELKALNTKPEYCPFPKEADYAMIVNDQGHPHMIKKGMKVKIVKVVQTPFYDLMLENEKYHRWLAEFEIIHPV